MKQIYIKNKLKFEMYSHEYQGKNIYTKLGDVIELKSKNSETGNLLRKSTINVIPSSKIFNKNSKEEDSNNKSKKIFTK